MSTWWIPILLSDIHLIYGFDISSWMFFQFESRHISNIKAIPIFPLFFVVGYFPTECSFYTFLTYGARLQVLYWHCPGFENLCDFLGRNLEWVPIPFQMDCILSVPFSMSYPFESRHSYWHSAGIAECHWDVQVFHCYKALFHDWLIDMCHQVVFYSYWPHRFSPLTFLMFHEGPIY